MTLEEEIRNFCEKTDKEIGEYWSNDYDELPLQIERFVKESKWVEAEKIKAKIEGLYLASTDAMGISYRIRELEEEIKALTFKSE
jgi:hypothetical protein